MPTMASTPLRSLVTSAARRSLTSAHAFASRSVALHAAHPPSRRLHSQPPLFQNAAAAQTRSAQPHPTPSPSTPNSNPTTTTTSTTSTPPTPPSPTPSPSPSPSPTSSSSSKPSPTPSKPKPRPSLTSPPPINDRLLKKTSIRFSLPDSTGSLSAALSHFHAHSINMTRVESRPNKRTSDYDFYIDFLGDSAHDDRTKALLRDLRLHTRDLHILEGRRVPWFPRRIRDLDLIANDVLDAGDEGLQADHPGFSDPAYRERRRAIAEAAMTYKIGQPIPPVAYTPEEVATWGAIWDRLTPLLARHACAEHVRLLPLLIENCGYRRDNIPQIADISDFLHECTGFQLRPVAGLLSARNFLYGLAFRVFFSTQYLRHHSRPLYTPEPDLVHELMGHAPMFADQAFADFSQEIGLASIGATDEQITRLSRCYWFSVEFGLCLQNGERKAYGAGLLSSFGELEWAMSEQPEMRQWNPFKAGDTEYPITEYQPVYYVASSFDDAKAKMQSFSNSFARPFNVRYNPYSQVIEVDGNISVEED